MEPCRTLLVTKNVPWPPNSGEKQRTLGVVRCVAGLGPVTVVGYAGEHDDATAGEADGVSVRAVPLRRPALLGWFLRTLRLRSLTAARWQQPALRDAVTRELERGVDAVVVEHVQLAGLLPRLPEGAARPVTVLDMHNVESELTRRLGRSSRSWRRLVYGLEAAALSRVERRAVRRFDLVTVVSDVDRDLLARRAPHDHVAVVPNAVDPGPDVLSAASGPTACFVGLLSWAPNADAAVAFTRDVWPLVREAVPDARLLLVGRDPTAEVRALAGDDVVVTGTVDDLRPYYEQSRVALAPLLAGGGSRLKILEALAWGRPVVATPVGVEGLEDLVGRGVLTATEPRELADLVAGLLVDPVRSAELGRAGAAAVRLDHSWPAATAPLAAALTRAVGPADRMARR